jgi:hypothetical protein
MHVHKYAQSHIIILQQHFSVIPVTETCCWRVKLCDCAYLYMCMCSLSCKKTQFRYTPMCFCIQFATAQYSRGKLHVFGLICVTDLVWHPPLHPVIIQMNVVHTHIWYSSKFLFTVVHSSKYLMFFSSLRVFKQNFLVVHLPIPATCRIHLIVDLLSLIILSDKHIMVFSLFLSSTCRFIRAASFASNIHHGAMLSNVPRFGRQKRERESFTRMFVKCMKQNPSWSLSASIKPEVQYHVHKNPQTRIEE